jgi:hypothetical protein
VLPLLPHVKIPMANAALLSHCACKILAAKRRHERTSPADLPVASVMQPRPPPGGAGMRTGELEMVAPAAWALWGSRPAAGISNFHPVIHLKSNGFSGDFNV